MQSQTDADLSDAFSKGQLCSKAWLTSRLSLIEADLHAIVICGGWYGILAPLLFEHTHAEYISSFDIDKKCACIANMVNSEHWHTEQFRAYTADMYDVDYNGYDTIINTSCEHIPDLRKWYNLIPVNKTVVLQSNNYYTGNGHISCVDSIDSFVAQIDPNEVLYAGTLCMPDYCRYMVVTKT